jgi:hypothetical protein
VVLHRISIARLFMVAMPWLVAGCAGLDGTSSAHSPAASIAVLEVTGTWRGTAGWISDYQYEGESSLTLQIGDDGKFTMAVKPNGGTNNYAKASALSGTVVASGNRVMLRNSEGPWTSLTLVRSGDTLYGVALDPAFEGNVMVKLDRDARRG